MSLLGLVICKEDCSARIGSEPHSVVSYSSHLDHLHNSVAAEILTNSSSQL